MYAPAIAGVQVLRLVCHFMHACEAKGPAAAQSVLVLPLIHRHPPADAVFRALKKAQYGLREFPS